ncbi:hypothetical protein ACVW2L_001895 [Mucilaginibacter sp. HD30]
MPMITERMSEKAVKKVGFPLGHELLQMGLHVNIDIDRTHTYATIL